MVTGPTNSRDQLTQRLIQTNANPTCTTSQQSTLVTPIRPTLNDTTTGTATAQCRNARLGAAPTSRSAPPRWVVTGPTNHHGSSPPFTMQHFALPTWVFQGPVLSRSWWVTGPTNLHHRTGRWWVSQTKLLSTHHDNHTWAATSASRPFAWHNRTRQSNRGSSQPATWSRAAPTHRWKGPPSRSTLESGCLHRVQLVSPEFDVPRQRPGRLIRARPVSTELRPSYRWVCLDRGQVVSSEVCQFRQRSDRSHRSVSTELWCLA